MVILFALPAVAAPRLGAPAVYGVDGAPVSVLWADLDGLDGPDLVVGNESGIIGPSVSALANRGNGSFLADRRLVALDPFFYVLHAAATAQLGGDALPDLVVVADEAAQLPARTVLLTYRNLGPAGFAAPVAYLLTGGFPQSVVAVDLDRDGLDDVVVADSSPGGRGQLTVLRAVADGELEADPAIAVGVTPTTMVVDDLDADGAIDLAVLDPGRAVFVLYGSGAGSFAAPVEMASTAAPTALAVVHQSGRAPADLVLGNQEGSLQLWRQSAPRQFAAVGTAMVGGPVHLLGGGDFDGNGVADVVLNVAGGDAVALWYGTTAPGFAFGESVGVAVRLDALVVGDANADGKPDVAVASAAGDRVVVILNGTDAPPTPSRTPTPTETSRPTATSTPTWTPTPTLTMTWTVTPTRTPTPSPSPSPTPAGPGDANCDDRLDARDLTAMIAEIFDRTCDKADANRDGRVSAADVTSLVRMLATP